MDNVQSILPIGLHFSYLQHFCLYFRLHTFINNEDMYVHYKQQQQQQQ